MDNSLAEMTSREMAPLPLAGENAQLAREQEMIKAMAVIANAKPRDMYAFSIALTKAVQRPTLADKATYRYPRGGSQIEGPSIYLAREAARLFGNIRYGVKDMFVTDEAVHFTAYAYDIESNSVVEYPDSVKKLIQRKNKQTGKTDWITPDERDLRELVNKRIAIGARNAILAIIPADIIEDATNTARDVRAKKAGADLDAGREQTIKKLVKTFDGIGVTVEMLERFLGHKVNLVDADELTTLREVYNSIHEGHAKREHHFKFDEGRVNLDDVKQSTNKARDAATKKPPEQDGLDLGEPLNDRAARDATIRELLIESIEVSAEIMGPDEFNDLLKSHALDPATWRMTLTTEQLESLKAAARAAEGE
jgi:hypothetical protein